MALCFCHSVLAIMVGGSVIHFPYMPTCLIPRAILLCVCMTIGRSSSDSSLCVSHDWTLILLCNLAFRWERQLCIYISVHWVLTIYNARVCKTRCSPRMCPGDRSSRCRFGTAGSPERITNHTGEVMVNCHNAMHEPQL